jgi:hypothetical protein
VSPDTSPSRPAQTDRLLAVYLRNHAAAARAGVDLFERMAASQARRSWGPALASLAEDVRDDLRALLRLLRERGIAPDPWLTLAVRAGERAGRLKPNGHLLSRSPLSDLAEVEAGLDAVHAKLAGWRALRAAPVPAAAATSPVDLAELERRAEDQLTRLRAVHTRVVATVL